MDPDELTHTEYILGTYGVAALREAACRIVVPKFGGDRQGPS